VLPSAVLLTVLLDATPAPARVLRLADAEKAAVAQQPTMREARAQTAAADARAYTARAPMLPQVTGIASYQRVRSSSLGGGGVSTPVAGTGTATTTAVANTSPSGIDIFTFGVSANQLIWDFGQSYGRYRAADRLTMSFEAQEKVASQTVMRDVRRAYFAARAQKALVTVARESFANVQRHMTQIQGFVNVGTRPEIDLAQARTDVANANVQVINAENAYSLSRAQLARAMGGGDLGLDFDVADDELSPVQGEEGTSADLTTHAQATRPELAALEKQRESQELTVKGLKGGYGPTLSASAGYQERGTALSDLGPAWNVGLTLAWPIFQGGTTVGQVREAEANLQLTAAQLDAQKLQISVDVQQAKLSLSAAKATVGAAEEVVTAAREQLRLAEGRYAQGVGSAIELGDAQVAVTSARAQLIQARFNVSAARADLLAALGRQ